LANGEVKRFSLCKSSLEAALESLHQRAKSGSAPPREGSKLSRCKKVARMLQKMRYLPGLSEHEKILFALSLVATPDERWRMHESFLRSHDLYTRSSRKRYGFSLQE